MSVQITDDYKYNSPTLVDMLSPHWDHTFARPVMSSMPMPSCVSSTVIWRRGHTDSQCLRFAADLNSNACRTSSGSAKSYLRKNHVVSPRRLNYAFRVFTHLMPLSKSLT